MLKLAVFVSGGGTDMQSIIDAIDSGYVKGAVIDYVVAGKEDCRAIERAKKHGIEYGVYEKKKYGSAKKMCKEIAEVLTDREIDLAILAGYLNIITEELLAAFPDRIINIHPSLIPKHAGMGYYGLKVHESVIRSGDTESGATVHYVNEIADGGRIILQRRVPVLPDDTAMTLSERVLELEHQLLPDAVNIMIDKINKGNTEVSDEKKSAD